MVGNILKGRNDHPFEGTFLAKNVVYQLWIVYYLPISKEMHNVVKVSGTDSLRKRPYLFGYNFFKRLTIRVNTLDGFIGIRVIDFSPNGIQNENFVCGQVELYRGNSAFPVQRPVVMNFPLR